mgnify:FL=1
MFTGAIRKIAAVAIVGACALGVGACDALDTSHETVNLLVDNKCQGFKVKTYGDPDIKYASRDKVLKDVFGLESGKEYPLQLGSQTAGIQGQFYSGFFATYGSLNGGPDVTVTFVQGNRRWPVTIPRDKIVFEVVDQLEDTSFALDINWLDESYSSDPHNSHNGYNLYTYKGGELVSPCYMDEDRPIIDLSKLTLGQTLIRWDESTITGATIKLTAEQYAQLVGTIDPTAPVAPSTPTE